MTKTALPLAAIALALLTGCATTPRTEDGRASLQQEAQAKVTQLHAQDSSLRTFLDAAYGYVVYPSIGKGGWIAGGAYGRGVVYEKGQLVGYSDVTQASLGLQWGGQSYSQIIAFETKDRLDAFKSGNFTFTANASAVAVKAGAAASTQFKDGVAIFTQSDAGLMAEAAVGGQRFTYQSAK